MEALTPRVFISNFVAHDYEDAKNYGPLIPITKGYVSFGSLDRLTYEIANNIKDSTPEDYLCLSGNNILSLIIGLLWIQKHKKIKMLVWDKRASGDGRSVYREWSVNEHTLIEVLNQT